MNASRTLFSERTVEIDLYFKFLEDIINRKGQLSFPLPNGSALGTEQEVKAISLDLSHTLKANGYLLLYNLIEATIVNAIEDIHLQIDSDISIDADKLVLTLTKRALKRFKAGNVQIAVPATVSQMLLRHWLDDHKEKVARNEHPLFSGNVDARKIREVGEIYGFKVATDTAITKDGAQLLKVKSKRNALAHGQVPFRECGRDTTLPELCEIKQEVVAYLNDVLTSVEAYLTNDGFRRTA
jgi:MAE_28990/MAE_18760-like HEPN